MWQFTLQLAASGDKDPHETWESRGKLKNVAQFEGGDPIFEGGTQFLGRDFTKLGKK